MSAASASEERCLNCGETRAYIRSREARSIGLICASVDYFGEVNTEFPRHRFRAHQVFVRNEQTGAGLWYAFCTCGWRAYNGARFVTREDARIAGREHRASPNAHEGDHRG